MERYRNLGGDSGVLSYEIGPDYLIVEFSDGPHKFYKTPIKVPVRNKFSI